MGRKFLSTHDLFKSEYILLELNLNLYDKSTLFFYRYLYT